MFVHISYTLPFPFHSLSIFVLAQMMMMMEEEESQPKAEEGAGQEGERDKVCII